MGDQNTKEKGQGSHRHRLALRSVSIPTNMPEKVASMKGLQLWGFRDALTSICTRFHTEVLIETKPQSSMKSVYISCDKYHLSVQAKGLSLLCIHPALVGMKPQTNPVFAKP